VRPIFFVSLVLFVVFKIFAAIIFFRVFLMMKHTFFKISCVLVVTLAGAELFGQTASPLKTSVRSNGGDDSPV